MTGHAYRLHAVATSTAEAVQYAGGWLFDRSMAGWRVTVTAGDESENERALRILGVEAATEPDPLAIGVLAVSAQRLRGDAPARELVAAVLAAGSREVLLWGDDLDGCQHATGAPSAYRLSAAAREFKRQALAAVALGRADCPQEVFVPLVSSGRPVPIDS